MSSDQPPAESDGEAETQPPTIDAPDEEASTVLMGDGAATDDTVIGTEHESTAESASPPQRFGDYELLGEIARGGMGVVYKARQVKLNRLVAVKMILSGNLAGEQDVARFYAEAEAAAKLDHAGIVPIYEVDEEAGQHFFSMGYVEGESLAKRLASGPLPPCEAAAVVRDIATALDYAHKHGVVHRDIKPSNILVTADGQLKVTDFGLAMSGEGGNRMTISGQVLGTPSYMPPEQASGDIHAIDHRADVYSLGALLYALLTGRPPFQAASVMETLKQVVNKPAVSPRLLDSAIDLDLETLCLKCLEKSPADRLDSAAELAAELQRYLDGEPIRSRRIGPVQKAYRWCKRHPLPVVTALSGVVLSLLAWFAWTLFGENSAKDRLAGWDWGVQQKLEQPAVNETFVAEVSGLIGQIETLDPELAESRRDQLRVALRGQVESVIRRPRIDESRAAAVRDQIEVLRSVSQSDASDMETLLEERLARWRPILETLPPYDALRDVFPDAKVIEVDQGEPGGVRLRAGPGVPDEERAVRPTKVDWRSPRVTTSVPTRGPVRLEAIFAEDWQDAMQVGLALYSDKGPGYEFLLNNPAAVPPRRQTFRELRAVALGGRSGEVLLDVRRDGTSLARRSVSVTDLPDGPLRLSASHVDGELEFRIGASGESDAALVRFYDPFGLEDTGGRFAVITPRDVHLLELRGEVRAAPSRLTEMELADQALRERRYQDAERTYRRVAVSADSPAVRQEAAFKRAVCLSATDESADAERILAEVAGQEGERWPALAALRLWVRYVAEDRLDEAGGVFDLLAARYRFDEVVTLLPDRDRQVIIDGYFSEFTDISELLTAKPNRIEDLRRATLVDRYLSSSGHGDIMRQIELIRAFRFENDFESALEIVQSLMDHPQSENATLHYHHQRLLRLTGRHDAALEQANAWIEDLRANNPDALPCGWLARARLFAAMNRWEDCEADLDRLLDATSEPNGRGELDIIRSHAWLMKGFLAEDRGDATGARGAWKRGYQEGHYVFELVRSGDSPHGLNESINVPILGALSGELSQGDIKGLLLQGLASGKAGVAGFLKMVSDEALYRAARDMWQTPRGNRLARALAFESLGLKDRMVQPIALMGSTYILQNAFPEQPAQADRDVLWSMFLEILEDTLAGKGVDRQQILRVGLTWKGQNNLLGWTGVAPTLTSKQRSQLAYAIGHKYARLGRFDEAKAFFDTSVKDGERDEQYTQRAAHARALVDSGRGELTLHAPDSEGVSVEVVRDEQVIGTLTVPSRTTLELAPGTYELRPAENRSQLNLPPRVRILRGAVSELRPQRRQPVEGPQ